MFTEQQRKIFGPYPNGKGQQLYADPVAAYRVLMFHTDGELNSLLDRYNADELGLSATAPQLASATCIAFDLEPFDRATGKGTLQDDALALLAQFMEWREEKKTPLVNSPTSA